MDTNGDTKMLLLKDLCSRLPYGVKVSLQYGNKQLIGVLDAVYPTEERVIVDKLSDAIAPIDVRCGGFKLNESTIMPYLRPMSSMTEEEREKFKTISHLTVNFYKYNNQIVNIKVDNDVSEFGTFDIDPCFRKVDLLNIINGLNWLNAHHFDYHGLIEKGLAIEAPEDMYDIKL